MPRPKYQKDDERAREKLIRAFWDGIGDMPFHKLTVTEVIRRAGLNRNSFYYHFECIDDMAEKVVEETLMRDLPGILVSELNNGSHSTVDFLLSDKGLRERFDHVCLLAGKNSSPQLQEMLKTAIADNWKSFLSIETGKLSHEDRLVFEFCLGGVLSLLAYRADDKMNPPIRDMFSTDFGKAALMSIAKLGKKIAGTGELVFQK